MNSSPCDPLDGYLADWLSETQRAAYEAHLANCQTCRRQIDLQRHIDRLLAQGVEQLEPLPPSLIDSAEAQIRLLQHRRTVRRVCGLTAAAVVVILAGVWSVLQKPTLPVEPPPIAKKEEAAGRRRERGDRPTHLTSPPESRVRVTLSDPSTGILNPVAMENPNVSFVWLYPTVTPTVPGQGVEAN